MKKTSNIALLLLAAVSVVLNIGIFHIFDYKMLWFVNLTAILFWFFIQLLFIRVGKNKTVKAVPILFVATVIAVYLIVTYSMGLCSGTGSDLIVLSPAIMLAVWMTESWLPVFGVYFFAWNPLLGIGMAYIADYISGKSETK